jgi:hypothetical protein
MTAVTVADEKYQVEVYSKEMVMRYFEDAKWQDLRIQAFGVGQKNPDLIFIDLDRKHFKSDRALKAALTKILKRIKKKIGGHPTVLWSGRGFHIIQPIKCDVDLDIVKEFADLVYYYDKEEVNKGFLQFASSYLSDDKRDNNNNVSLKSCLLRIPGSLNSKCKKEEGTDPEVKIVQKWDGFRPDVRLMLGSFYSHLVDEKIKEEREREKYANIIESQTSGGEGMTTIWWIEKLLDTPISDYRQIARDLIIVPYLIVRRGMTDVNEIGAIVMRWADKCNELEPLNPSYRKYRRDLRYRIRVVMRNMVPPMRFDTLQEENPELAKELSTSGGS